MMGKAEILRNIYLSNNDFEFLSFRSVKNHLHRDNGKELHELFNFKSVNLFPSADAFGTDAADDC